MADWTDQFVGDRMAVDQQFTDRIQRSAFNRQEWSTIMTAVEFDIEQPATPKEASLIARTERIRDVMPAVEEIHEQSMPMGGQPDQSGSPGLFDRLAAAVGFGNGEDKDELNEQRLEAAQDLAGEYATAFEAHLKEQGKWADACAAAAATTEH